MRNIEHIAAIAYEGFCLSLCRNGLIDNTGKYIESFYHHMDADIRKAWVAAVSAAVDAWDNGSENRDNT